MTSARSGRRPSVSTRSATVIPASRPIVSRSASSESRATPWAPTGALASFARASMLPPVAMSPLAGAASAMSGKLMVLAYSETRRRKAIGSAVSAPSSSSSRTEPMVCDSDHAIALAVTRDTSTLPPPRSTISHRSRPKWMRLLTARHTSRASSLPLMVSSRSPVSRRMSWTSCGPLWLSRTALVATAR